MPNRLADAISPYLRSHAGNPVDWYGWGADAFAEARERDVPVLVSIGYSTCHWCHVMARESFSDPALATYLNEHFVSIKVDREEHPDVDASYLSAASAFTDSLGWPLNVFVTPEGQAFYAGTYFPPQPMQGHPSFRQVLEAVTDAWLTRRDEVASSATRVAEALTQSAVQHTATSAVPDAATLTRAVAELVAYEDTTYGGFGGAPKFPVAPTLAFLLNRPGGAEPMAQGSAEQAPDGFGPHGRSPEGDAPDGQGSDGVADTPDGWSPDGDAPDGHAPDGQDPEGDAPDGDAPDGDAPEGRIPEGDTPEGRSPEGDAPDGQALALRTLKRMGASPLRDPVEGGFFRYAVNRDWSEPHYERMLYDNAQLLDLYTQAWKLTGEQWARVIAEGIARYLTTVMQLPGGGFASAQDSESTVAGKRVEGGYYALEQEGRKAETPPALDEKVLTGWNGLAISALARAGFAFSNLDLTIAARRAADYLLEHHERGDGTLVRASIEGRASTAQATLEDFGMCAHGLLELALVTGEVSYATAARRLIDSTLSTTTDSPTDSSVDIPVDTPSDNPTGRPHPAPFGAPNGADPVLVAQGLVIDVDPSEGAYPSGLTASADAAHLLYLLTAESGYLRAAEGAMTLIAGLAPARPIAFGAALRLMSDLATPVEQLVIVSPDDTQPESTAPADSTVLDNGLPNSSLLDTVRRHATGVIASVTASQAEAFAHAGFDLFSGRTPRDNLPTVFLCRDFVCRLPVTDSANLASELDRDPVRESS